MKTKILIATSTSLIIGCLIIIGATNKDDSGTNTAPKYNAINVKGDNWYSLDEFDVKARRILKEKTDFTDKNQRVNAWVDSTNAQWFVLMHYGSDIGHPFWSVGIGRNGNPMFYEHGILGENGHTNYEHVDLTTNAVTIKK